MEWNREAWLARPVPIGGEESERAVRRKADELVAAARARNPGWTPPPFDPRVLADALEVPVRMSSDLGDWDALLLPAKDGPRIFCNDRIRSPGRIAFSIAHEIAHLFFEGCDDGRYHLRAQDKAEYYRTQQARELERLCDLAAAELLMPRGCFGDAVADHGFRAMSVPILAEEFAVSREAAAIRLVETSRTPCAAGSFHHAAQPSWREGAPRTRVRKRVAYRARRVFRSPGFPFLFPEGKSVPEDSAVYRASLGRKEVAAVETHALGRERRRMRVTAFPLRPDDRSDEPPVVWATFRLA